MKPFLSLCYCLLVLPVFSQKISEHELNRYEWIVYNKSVDDSSEIFGSDTLLLSKSYDHEASEEVSLANDLQGGPLCSRCWQLKLHLSSEEDTITQINEFYFSFVDLRKAAERRPSLYVDSITYQLLWRDPNTSTSETAPVLSKLESMQDDDVIQIVDSTDNQFYYIEKKGDALRVLKNLRKRYVLQPKGINEGFWTFSKRKQVITFSSYTEGIRFAFQIERIDNMRVRLVPISLND